MSNHEEIQLNICVPTYNREYKLKRILDEFQKYKKDNIELHIVDNASEDGTEELVKKYYNSYIYYHKNIYNIGGVSNIIKALTYGNGRFTLLLLDKDYFKVDYLDKLVEFIRNQNEIVAGFCKLNLSKSESCKIYSGRHSLEKMAYLQNHPTGYFFKRELLNKLNIMEKYEDTSKVGAFAIDFILTDICYQGKTVEIGFPAFYTETEEEARNIKSFTYNLKQNNVYFFPENRYKQFQLFLEHLKTLPIKSSQKRIIEKKLLKKLIWQITYGYQSVMRNGCLCMHHGVQSREVSNSEIKLNLKNYYNQYINEKTFQKRAYKIIMGYYYRIKVLLQQFMIRI